MSTLSVFDVLLDIGRVEKDMFILFSIFFLQVTNVSFEIHIAPSCLLPRNRILYRCVVQTINKNLIIGGIYMCVIDLAQTGIGC